MISISLAIKLLNFDKIDKHLAKKCALIAVEEILKLPIFWDDTKNNIDESGTIEFWQQVKKEIEKL